VYLFNVISGSSIEKVSITQVVSYSSENTLDTTPTAVSYTASSLLNYSDEERYYKYSYPSDWEFVPSREGMGLRPKDYSNADFNEIVTVLFFKDKGSNLRESAQIFDGGFDEDWIDIEIYNKTGLYYNYSSENLNNMIYWFSNGKDAVKIMFRKFNKFPNDGHLDNSSYKPGFDIVLETFRFL